MTNHRAGFTLLELVLAMSALALVVALCYGAFHLAMRAVERGEVAVETEQHLRVATDVLVRQIKSAAPYPARTADDEVYPYFVGSATALTFVTAAAQQTAGGLVRVVYRLESDPTRLVLEESPFFAPDSVDRAAEDTPSGASAVLLDGFRSLTFEYLYSDGADTEWRPSWNGADGGMMPAAVRIVITGVPGLEEARWGEEIPIMAAAYGGRPIEDDANDALSGDGDDAADAANGNDGAADEAPEP